MLKVRWQSKKITWNQHYTLRSMISRKININFCKITTLSSFTKESLLSPKNFFSWNRFINYVGFTNISLSILKIRTINLLFIIKVAPIAWWLRPLSCGICWLNYQPWWAPNLIALFMGVSLATCSPNFGVHSSQIKFLRWKFNFKDKKGVVLILIFCTCTCKIEFSLTEISASLNWYTISNALL